ncbi:hypothetical protein [Halobacteriovorax sp. HLS]|uniref:hypothetical protein n=1 Tax=Halobacteriovorax sp. HLS TaxID=2234000 RepID=UPI000FD7128A|nr:hypothetical protein [Halobacteriovorax sp. HLS]
MNNKTTALLIVKPIIILALMLAFRPQTVDKSNLTNNQMTEEVQSMRGYFLEDQAMKIIVFHKRVQALKNELVSSKLKINEEIKTSFISMVKEFNLAINEFEKLEEYKSENWNNHRQQFITYMKSVELKQISLQKELRTLRTTVSI